MSAVAASEEIDATQEFVLGLLIAVGNTMVAIVIEQAEYALVGSSVKVWLAVPAHEALKMGISFAISTQFHKFPRIPTNFTNFH